MKTKYKNSVREVLMEFAERFNYREMYYALKEKVEEQWPKENQKYWYIDSTAIVDWAYWNNDNADKYRLKTGLIFKTKSEAEARLKEVMEGK